MKALQYLSEDSEGRNQVIRAGECQMSHDVFLARVLIARYQVAFASLSHICLQETRIFTTPRESTWIGSHG